MLVGTPSQQAGGHRSLALLEMFRGRYGAADEHLRDAVLLNRGPKSPVSDARNHLFLAVAFQAQGKTQGVHADMAAAYDIFMTAYLDPTLVLYAAMLSPRGVPVRRAS